MNKLNDFVKAYTWLYGGSKKKAESVYCRAMEIASSSVPSDCTELTVYVTGLTVAMLTVVNLCLYREITLTAMHFNRETGEYYPQSILEYSRCGFCSGKLEVHNHYCPHCGAN